MSASAAVRNMLKAMGLPSSAKAKKMLEDPELTPAKKRLLEMIISGKIPTKLADASKAARRSVQA